ncbi:type II toxin-antitoxin system HicA family toxin [Mobiluncus mulieris]|uniref:type II toxin-antitoxin system HicA family toxin n=1 Tax=Mobiluncus mulieris TaxID=2052 RepID=UPI00147937B6|nr:type II toxin-antitoxin system HicA family toxin [Mobiluncus mulieris]
MTKPMKYRKLAALLRQAGFIPRPGKGDHEMWRNGSTSVVITKTCEVSPKVTRDALNAIEKVKGCE